MVNPDDCARRRSSPASWRSRPASLCRGLNRRVRNIVIGGMANDVRQALYRATEDIDLLVDTAPDNVQRLRRALADLPDWAVRDMADSDLDLYVVVRVADEIVVDLDEGSLRDHVRRGQGARRDRHDRRCHDLLSPHRHCSWRTTQTSRDKDSGSIARCLGLTARRTRALRTLSRAPACPTVSRQFGPPRLTKPTHSTGCSSRKLRSKA